MNLENKKQIATILLALGLGLVASVGTSQYVKSSIQSQTKRIAKEYEKQNSNQKAAFITELQRLDKSYAGRMKKLEQNIKKLEKRPVQVVSPVAGRKFTPPVDTTIFSYLTPPGKRALTVLIDSLSAVGGLINPGDYVDIIAHLKIPKSYSKKTEKQEIITVLFQNIQVLAVGANFRSEGSSELYNIQKNARSLNVTLALDPEQAGLLTFAQTNGKLQLALRSPAEDRTSIIQVASWEALSDYAKETQGTEIEVPKKKAKITTIIGEDSDEVESFIQIFRGGREL